MCKIVFVEYVFYPICFNGVNLRIMQTSQIFAQEVAYFRQTVVITYILYIFRSTAGCIGVFNCSFKYFDLSIIWSVIYKPLIIKGKFICTQDILGTYLDVPFSVKILC